MRFGNVAAGTPHAARIRGTLAAARGDYETAESEFRWLAETQEDPFWQATSSYTLSVTSQVQGKLQDAERWFDHNMDVNEGRGVKGNVIWVATRLGIIDLRFRGDPAGAMRRVEEVLARVPLEELAPVDRPYVGLAMFYAEAGEPELAKRLLAEYEAEVPEPIRQGDLAMDGAVGHIALAEGRSQDAIDAFRAWHDAGDSFCAHCAELLLGRAFEQAGNPDSALASYERAVNSPGLFRVYQEENQLGQTYKRLGELYEERGDTANAVEYYNRFVDLWSEADPELQPVVGDVRGRIARLVGEG